MAEKEDRRHKNNARKPLPYGFMLACGSGAGPCIFYMISFS